MEKNTVSRFFLGANAAGGFRSLYDGFVDQAGGDFLWVIKGGPGCGKSTFMKIIGAAAQEQGLAVEYIHCSGDPDSLDGVYIPAIRTGYADGTAPHVLDPLYPAAAGLYLDLGAFYDPAALEGKLDEIIRLYSAYKACYTRAYSSLTAAADLDLARFPGLITPAEQQAARRRADSAISNELHKSGHGSGKVRQRFLGAITCQGEVFQKNTLRTLCSRIYTLDDEYGLGDLYLRQILQAAVQKQYDLILCPDWLQPDRLQALLIPELALGFVAHRSEIDPEGDFYRHIRLDAIVPIQTVRSLRPKLRSSAKLITALKNDAISSLRSAKALHDQLEAVYNPHVDFAGLREVADSHIRWIKEQLD